MVVSIKDIQQLNCQQVFDELQTNIDSLLEQFEHLDLTTKDYYKLVLAEIQASKTTYDGQEPYLDFILKRIASRMFIKETEMINDKTTSSKVIDRYISKEFKNIDNYQLASQKIIELSDYLAKHEWEPDLDVLLDLMNRNNAFNSAVKMFFENNQKTNNIKNNIMATIIDAYCVLEDTEVDEEVDEKNIKLPNSFRLYLSEITAIPLLSDEQTRDLFAKVKEHDKQARNKLVESNLRLVIRVAKRYYHDNASFLDIIQEGNIGLMKAVDKYDISKNVKFSSYAVYWIKQAIIRFITNKSRNIRLPEDFYWRVYKFQQAENFLSNELNRNPNLQEIADYMGISLEEAKHLKYDGRDTISLNALVTEDENAEFGDFIPSDYSLEDAVIGGELSCNMGDTFTKAKLTKKEKEILIARFGLNNQTPKKLHELGAQYHVTRQCINNAERKAIMKLKKFYN